MANRFVSAGAIDASTGKASEAPAPARSTPAASGPAAAAAKNNPWETVQKELQAERLRREEQRGAAAQGGQKSLYEVLQENKAAKQAAFEEANKIKNQFRPLDEDEIDFLDDVRASKRAEEDRVRRETEEGLRAFREARKDGAADGEAGAGDAEDEEVGEEGWAVVAGRKRRREREALVKGVKRRATSEGVEKARKDGSQEGRKEAEGDVSERAGKKAVKVVSEPVKPASQGVTTLPTLQVKKAKAGLVEYGSSDDEDN